MNLAHALVAFASAVSMALAHTHLSHLTLDGKRYAAGECIKPYPKQQNDPVKNPASTDLTCGLNSLDTKAAKTCPVRAGSRFSVEWQHFSDSPTDPIISASHAGPCLIYMAPLSSGGKGSTWFKIFEQGYDASSKKWCVDNIRANKGRLDITLPAELTTGDYLLRTEIIALHQAMDDYAKSPSRGAQYYVNCGQISVTNGGTASPKGYAIPGIYKTNDPGILFNRYKPFTSYPLPGPPLAFGNSKGGNQTSPVSTASSAPARNKPTSKPTNRHAPLKA